MRNCELAYRISVRCFTRPPDNLGTQPPLQLVRSNPVRPQIRILLPIQILTSYNGIINWALCQVPWGWPSLALYQSKRARVAQWQSSCFVNRWLSVRIRPPAIFLISANTRVAIIYVFSLYPLKLDTISSDLPQNLIQYQVCKKVKTAC